VVAGFLIAGWVHTWQTYFGVQLWDSAVWAAYSTGETKIGQVIRDEGADADIYIAPVFLGGPTETFIIGHPPNAQPFEMARTLPLEPHGRKALVFFDGSEKETVDLMRRYYPGATIEGFGPPRPDGSSGEPILWIVRVPASAIEALLGWTVEYRPTDGRPAQS